jgi:hypothetical protein
MQSNDKVSKPRLPKSEVVARSSLYIAYALRTEPSKPTPEI